MLRANTYGGDNLVELRFRWPTAHLMHPSYFNNIQRSWAGMWVREFPSYEAESHNPMGTAFVNKAVVLSQMCTLLPLVPAGELAILVDRGFEVSWEKSDCGTYRNITIKSNDEEE
tara:strand:+ start:2714 stop:3058 length:345 start_codon:yes stop_codon:yes gene_type:complete